MVPVRPEIRHSCGLRSIPPYKLGRLTVVLREWFAESVGSIRFRGRWLPSVVEVEPLNTVLTVRFVDRQLVARVTRLKLAVEVGAVVAVPCAGV